MPSGRRCTVELRALEEEQTLATPLFSSKFGFLETIPFKPTTSTKLEFFFCGDAVSPEWCQVLRLVRADELLQKGHTFAGLMVTLNGLQLVRMPLIY